MYSLFSLAALGLDSFLACLVIDARSMPWRDRVGLALAFGGWDAMATLAGSLSPHRSLELSAIMLWALWAFLLCGRARPSRRFLHLLPVLLSLDNLFAGSPASMAPAIAVSSASMALCGLFLGSVCWRTLFALTTEA
jgi:hypothetical protein